MKGPKDTANTDNTITPRHKNSFILNDFKELGLETKGNINQHTIDADTSIVSCCITIKTIMLEEVDKVCWGDIQVYVLEVQ